MKKKSVLSILIAFIMFFTVFAATAPEAEAASKNTYWIKINTVANVITVYKKSGAEYKPVRAMLCSTGKNSSPTIHGNYKIRKKLGWNEMFGGVWGQYSMQIKGNYLIHTVCSTTKSKRTMMRNEFNKLGTDRSMGCVRLCTMDAKWIWDHCPKGTKITIYKSKNPGPLGKPKPIKMKKNWKWDPTDPSPSNPNFSMRKPAIYISKKKATSVEYGKKYSLKAGVTAKNLNAYQNLTSNVKVASVYKYNSSKKKYVKSSFSTKKLGTYKIIYKCYDKYCKGTGYKTFKVKVVDTLAPTIKASNRTVTLDTSKAKNAVKGVTAKQKSRSRTSAITVKIKAPGASEYKTLTYAKAKKYVFNKAGKYTIIYSVKNCYSPYKKATKKVYVTCKTND